jgi:hypothetical protein
LPQSESVLALTKTHSKNAKKYEEEAKVSAATAKKLIKNFDFIFNHKKPIRTKYH